MATPTTSKFCEILDRPSIIDNILDYCTPLAIFRLKTTSYAANKAVHGYITRTFDINSHLEHFFDDPISFRVLQARTNAIVSGSNALQFFDRTHYERSDLDVYVSGVESTKEVCDWLENNCYVYRPTPGTFLSCDDVIEKFSRITLRDGEIDGDASDWDLMASRDSNNTSSYRRYVLNFFREKEQDKEGFVSCSWRQVQVITGSNCSIEAILCYHSTVVLNFYTHIAAYSLFPRGTFERRLMVTCDVRDYEERGKVLETKYSERGWTVIHDLPKLFNLALKSTKECARLDYVLGQRSVGDESTWVLPFNDAQFIIQAAFPNGPVPLTTVPKHLSRSGDAPSGRKYRDPATLNTFNFTYNPTLCAFEIHFNVMRHSFFAPSFWIGHKNETCYTLSRELSTKMTQGDFYREAALRAYTAEHGGDGLLANVIEMSVNNVDPLVSFP